ncbi:crosslink repair DNA glycosylase YcaQ family protein [Actinosynnema sp. NPDC020468]|uniref:DNA glycosylase AlkZ-like family protein n=1 Tax=Actinosynnema sp. NPDC020468 TaxID=3154488 RepID=UPI0033F7D7C1
MADRARVLAFRVAAHGFDRAAATPSDLRVFDLGVQDSERSALPALAARLDAPSLDGFRLTWSVRGAPHWHRAAELPALAARLWPFDDADAVSRMNRPPVTDGLAVFTEVVRALRGVVKGPMTKGEASTALTPLVPAEVTAHCRGCGSTHVQDPIFRLAVLPAGLRFDPDERTVTFVPLAKRLAIPQATKGFLDLARAYLRLHGPAGPSEVARYFGAPVRGVKALWPEDLVEVTPGGWLPADVVGEYENPPEPDLTRLLPPLDPYLNARDRDLLVPDKGRQKEIWRILGRPGAIVVDGEVVGTWRAKTAGRRLDVTLKPFAGLDLGPVEDEARRLAAARGLDDVRLS